MTEYLFSYGTLQREKVQLEVFGRKLSGNNDLLKGYKAEVIVITDESFLAKGDGTYQRIARKTNNPADMIEGMVFELSAEELTMADSYEPPEYKREIVQLASGEKAWMYIAKGNQVT